MDSTQLITSTPGQSAARPTPFQTLKFKTVQYGDFISIIVSLVVLVIVLDFVFIVFLIFILSIMQHLMIEKKNCSRVLPSRCYLIS